MLKTKVMLKGIGELNKRVSKYDFGLEKNLQLPLVTKIFLLATAYFIGGKLV